MKENRQGFLSRAIKRLFETFPVFQKVLQAVKKVQYSWAFSHLYGTISMGDERCLNEENWIG